MKHRIRDARLDSDARSPSPRQLWISADVSLEGGAQNGGAKSQTNFLPVLAS